MTYCKNYCEEEGISTSELNEAQKTLFYIAENMRMARSISEEGYRHFQMAIKALEQEPNETITEFADRCRECGAKYGKLLKQEPKWIPVSERLPEEKTTVLISCEDYYLRDLNPCIGWRNGQYWNTFTANSCKQILYPIAWMPLPEPCKAELRGEE